MLPALSPRSSAPTRLPPRLRSQICGLLCRRDFFGLSWRQLEKTAAAAHIEKLTHDYFSRCCCSTKRVKRSSRLVRTEGQKRSTSEVIRCQLRRSSARGCDCDGSRIACATTRQMCETRSCYKRQWCWRGLYQLVCTKGYFLYIIPQQWSSRLMDMRFHRG